MWWPKISAALSAMSRAVLPLMPLMMMSSSSRGDATDGRTDGCRRARVCRASRACARSTRGRGFASSDARGRVRNGSSNFFFRRRREIDDGRQTTTTTTDDASATR